MGGGGVGGGGGGGGGEGGGGVGGGGVGGGGEGGGGVGGGGVGGGGVGGGGEGGGGKGGCWEGGGGKGIAAAAATRFRVVLGAASAGMSAEARAITRSITAERFMWLAEERLQKGRDTVERGLRRPAMQRLLCVSKCSVCDVGERERRRGRVQRACVRS